MNRRSFLKATACACTAAPHLLVLRARAADAPDSASDPLLSEAEERIQKVRKGPGTIAVKDSNGKSLSGVNVRLEQVRHEFLFGCNFFMFNRCGEPALEEAYRSLFADMFNYCTLGFYWANYERERGKPNYAYTDQVLAWTRDRQILCKGHPLVWDHPAGSPRWLPESPAEIERLSNERVREIVERFKDRLELWDVVNEATHLPDKMNKTRMAEWGLAKTPVPYTADPLKIARESNPAATLLVNDYRLDLPYFRLLEALLKQDPKCFDAVGLQSHMHDGPWPAARVGEMCERYAALGLPLHFTETTLVSGPRTGRGENWGPTTGELEEKQARQTEAFYTLVFAQPAVRALTWWDFSDRGAWQGAAAGWVRKDMSRKPVYDRMQALIKGRWWSRSSGRTDEAGRFNTSAFYGDYVAVVEAPGKAPVRKELHWRRGVNHEITV